MAEEETKKEEIKEEIREDKKEENKEDKEEQAGFLGGAFLEIGKMMGLASSEKEKSKKEVQATLKGSDKNNEKVSKDELLSILKLISPGTNFRAALNNIVQGGKGALIAV